MYSNLLVPKTIHSCGSDEISQKFDICRFSDFFPTFVIVIIEIVCLINDINMIDLNKLINEILNNDFNEIMN